jgi:ABC-type multidrug transport system fused ATPase/permease subunit
MTGKGDVSVDMKQGNLREMRVTIRRLLSYLTVYRFRLSAAIILMIGFALAMGILPTLMGAATDIIAGRDHLKDSKIFSCSLFLMPQRFGYAGILPSVSSQISLRMPCII